MKKYLSTTAPFWEAADGGSGSSMFKAGEGSDGSADTSGAGAEGAGDNGGSDAAATGESAASQPASDGGTNSPLGGEEATGEGDGAGDSDRPDWLLSKFKTAEDQAKGYKELQAKLHTKTDLLRQEVLQEAVAEYGKTVGVPEDASEYEYPEGVTPPGEEVDSTLREWAKEHNVSPDGFQKLISDVYAKTLTDAKAEFAKLGTEEEATARIDAVNKWANKNFTEDDHGTLTKIMQTADGVGFLERMMNKGRQSGVFTNDGQGPATPALTRESIRNMQADPKFGVDDAYTAKVRSMWEKYAALPDDKKK